jgi:hypothetical protein
MIVDRIAINCAKIHDWPSFHDEFAKAFGFPEFYGRNMDAWIDCLTSLDEPEDGMSTVHCRAGSVLTLELKNLREWKDRNPELYDAVIECSAFVNWRRIEMGDSPVLALSFHKRK